MNNLIEQLADLQTKMDDAEKKMNMIEGQVKEIRSVLKKDFGVSTLAEAEALLKELRKEYEELRPRLKKSLHDMEEAYEH